MNNISAEEILNRVWNYAHVLRDEGVGYGDYVEQLTPSDFSENVI
jgi:type I restriction enzyme M protein